MRPDVIPPVEEHMLAEAAGCEPDSPFNVAEFIAWKTRVSTAEIYQTGTFSDAQLVSSLSENRPWFDNLATLCAVKEEARLRREEVKQARMDALQVLRATQQMSLQITEIRSSTCLLSAKLSRKMWLRFWMSSRQP